jgi:ABC-type lipoprotein release transport system permease subunit
VALRDDMRHSFRGLVRAPGFAAALVASAAIGIGVTAVVFGFIGHLVDPAQMAGADPAEWQARVGTIRLLLVTVALFVFVISAASVTGLMLSRAASRVHETSVRVALGAHGRTMIRPLLAEGLVVAIASVAFGVLAAFWTVHGLPAAFYAEDIEALPFVVDWRGVIGAALLGTVVVFAGALAPLAWTSRGRPAPDSRGTGPGLANTFGGWRSALVIGQLALCAALLISTGTVVEHLEAALRTDHAQRTGDAIVVRIAQIKALDGFLDGLKQTVGDGPVAIVGALPGGRLPTVPFRTGTGTGAADPLPMGVNIVDGGQLALSGLLLSDGRTFDAGDKPREPAVALVNLQAAELIRSTTGQNPLGQSLREPHGRAFEIVGLVREATFRTLQAHPEPAVYLPYSQHQMTSLFLIAIGNGSRPPGTTARVAERLSSVKTGRLTSVTTLQEHLHNTAAPADRLVTTVVQVFAGLAVLLSLIGVTGVTMDVVARRTPEIALRIALGAPRWRIVSGVVTYGVRLAVAGATVGILACLAVFRFVAPMPDGSRGPALWLWAAAPAVLLCMVIVSTLVPARRALGVDPSRLLRE